MNKYLIILPMVILSALLLTLPIFAASVPTVAGTPTNCTYAYNNGDPATATTLTVTANQPRSIIEYSAFALTSTGTLAFEMGGNADWAILNRYTGTSQLNISGTIKTLNGGAPSSNGQVFIVCPNVTGTQVGSLNADSLVSVGALVLSTLDISDANFLSSNIVFTEGSHGGSAYGGKIKVRPGASAASTTAGKKITYKDYVAILSNDGVVVGNSGTYSTVIVNATGDASEGTILAAQANGITLTIPTVSGRPVLNLTSLDTPSLVVQSTTIGGANMVTLSAKNLILAGNSSAASGTITYSNDANSHTNYQIMTNSNASITSLGSIGQTSPMTIGCAATFTTTGSSSNIKLINKSNSIGGAVSLNTPGAGTGYAALYNSDALILINCTVNGDGGIWLTAPSITKTDGTTITITPIAPAAGSNYNKIGVAAFGAGGNATIDVTPTGAPAGVNTAVDAYFAGSGAHTLTVNNSGAAGQTLLTNLVRANSSSTNVTVNTTRTNTNASDSLYLAAKDVDNGPDKEQVYPLSITGDLTTNTFTDSASNRANAADIMVHGSLTANTIAMQAQGINVISLDGTNRPVLTANVANSPGIGVNAIMLNANGTIFVDNISGAAPFISIVNHGIIGTGGPALLLYSNNGYASSIGGYSLANSGGNPHYAGSHTSSDAGCSPANFASTSNSSDWWVTQF